MNVEFFTPAPDKSIGGIDLAIKGMVKALKDRHTITLRTSGTPQENTQIVHFHGLWKPSHNPAYRFCRKHKVPYIISPHGMLEPWAYRHRKWKKWLWWNLFAQTQFDGAACVLGTSQMEVDHLRAFAKNPVVAPLGLNEPLPVTRDEARTTLGLTSNDQVVLYLSRIDRKKGLDLLIPAMKNHPHWQLWIVGDGDPAFEQQLKTISTDQVHWIGAAWGADRWSYLLAADLFCLPTHSENFGFAILESLWAGTPTLTTRQTPWIEYENLDGLYLCDDNLDSLSDALNSILPNLSRPAQLSEWATTNFHWNHLADRYHQIYHSAVSS